MAKAPAYQPRWTEGQPGGSKILDRNLREIAAALSEAFGVINDLRTTIINITGGDTTNVTNLNAAPTFPPGLELIGADESSDAFMGPPGRDGRQGVDGRPGFGMDGDAGEDGMAGPPGQAGAAGAAGATGATGAIGPPGFANDGEDGIDGLIVPGATGATGSAGAPGVAGPPSFLMHDDGEEGPQGFPGKNATFNGLGFLHVTTANADRYVTRQGNGFSEVQDFAGVGIGTTLDPNEPYETYVVVGPYTIFDGYALTVPDHTAFLAL